nr:MAG TPA: hypothetical protein [Caudoviricetes sp.]
MHLLSQQRIPHLHNTFICFFKHIWLAWILFSSYAGNNPIPWSRT